MSLPPPPWVPGLPWWGATSDLLRNSKDFLVRQYEKLGPAFQIRFLGKHYVVMAGPEALQFFVSTGEKHFTRAAFYSRFGKELGTDEFILGAPGGTQKHLRKMMRIGFSRQVAAPYLEDMIGSVGDEVRRWQPGQRVRVMETTAALAFTQYGWIVAARSLRQLFPDALAYTEAIMKVGTKIVPPLILQFPGYRRSKSRVFALVKEVIDQRRATSRAAAGRYTLIDALLAAKGDDGLPLVDEEVRAVALYGFVGTLVYMNRLISFLLYEILRDPSLRDTITREVDAAFGDGCPSVATLRTMKTLYTAYLETLRFHPIALALPFIANEDFVFHDYSIRKGQYLFVSLVPNHFSAEHYREPERFDAGRCAAPRNEHRHPGSFAPFGAATRFCAAQGLVEIITLSLVATLLRTVDLEIEPAGYRLKTRLAPLPGPEQGFTIRVTAQRERPVSVAPSVLAPKESFVNLLRNLESSEFAETMRSVTSATYGPGDVIVAEGDPADRFYIIQDGEVEVTRHAAGTPPRVLNRLGPGDFFGELGLLEGGRRHATVSAVGTSPVRTLVLDREGFMNLVAGSDMISDEITQAVRHRYVSSRLSDAFPRMDRAGLDRLLPEFRLSRHEPGDLLIREGDAPDRFFILTKGRTQVLNKGIHGKEVVLADLGPGSWFGEIGLLKGIPRTATVRAETPVETLELDRDGFQKLIAADESIKVDFEALMSRRLTQMDAERKT